MREILFRGKRFNGEWIYGYYHGKMNEDCDYIYCPYDATHYGVDNSTICEYIGLKDKRGNKIFENDLCSVTYLRRDKNRTDICRIVYRNSGCWCKSLSNEIEFDLSSDICDENNDIAINVIGNIHDDPEFLKNI